MAGEEWLITGDQADEYFPEIGVVSALDCNPLTPKDCFSLAQINEWESTLWLYPVLKELF